MLILLVCPFCLVWIAAIKTIVLSSPPSGGSAARPIHCVAIQI